jgi:hypothetical protein
LWHINDRDEPWPTVNVTGITVYYSGGGVVCPDQGEGICPAIRSALDVEKILGPSFAPLLIEYAWAKEKGESARRPWFLKPPTAQHNLMALSVLCQGYLAAHVPSEGAELSMLKEALERMGWNAFLRSDSGRMLAKQAADRTELTEDPKWWGMESGDSRLHSTLRRELRESGMNVFTDSISHLAQRIDEKKPIAETNLVAQAYLDIAKILGPQGQSGAINLNWPTRNSCLRHGWLRNRYMNRLGAFLARLGSPKPDVRLLRRFLEEDFEEWSVRRQDFSTLVNLFVIEMSPASLFSEGYPLSQSPDYVWLRDLADNLWRVRYPVDIWTRRANEAIEKADKAFDEASKAYRTLEQKDAVGADAAAILALRADFLKFSDTCERVAETLRDFPDRVLVT